MARPVITSMLIDSTVLFAPGGDVHQWTKHITRYVAQACKAYGPPAHSMRRATTRYVSTGKLARSIQHDADTIGPRQVDGIVWVDVPYAQYVLGGTAYQGYRYIYSRAGYPNKALIDATITRRGVRAVGAPKSVTGLNRRWVMRFRTDDGRYFRVHGQKRNPFMTNGYNAVAKVHRALGEFRTPYL